VKQPGLVVSAAVLSADSTSGGNSRSGCGAVSFVWVFAYFPKFVGNAAITDFRSRCRVTCKLQPGARRTPPAGLACHRGRRCRASAITGRCGARWPSCRRRRCRQLARPAPAVRRISSRRPRHDDWARRHNPAGRRAPWQGKPARQGCVVPRLLVAPRLQTHRRWQAGHHERRKLP
jgi:hypothetical protein